jgi:two-component system chemotaxis response regulator CheY
MTIDASRSYALPARLDLAAAQKLQADLIEALRDARALRLDASAVDMLGAPCLQIILAAIRSHPVTIENPSAAFCEAVSGLGLEDEIFSACEVRSNEETEACRRILVIDDSKTMRDMLMLTLRDAGYDVLQAVDGEDGVNRFREARVDAVITDINMPRMDGYGVIRHLRGDPANAALPILVLSTESEADKRDLARDAGATGWMVKPFDPERLVETIRKVCS